MASRGVSPKLLQSLRGFLRPCSSSPPSLAALPPLNLVEKPPIHTGAVGPSVSDSVLDLDDAERLFGSFSTAKLLRSSANLQMASIDPLVDVGMWVMNSRLMEMPLIGDVVVGALRHTFFEHFCAGVNHKEMSVAVRRLWETGMRGMLVYGVEDVYDNESCERNFERFLETIESTESLPPSSASFVIVKITAICPMPLLERVSDLLRWEHKDPSFHLPWKLNTLPIFSQSSPLYHTSRKPDPLTAEEEKNLQLAHQRLLKLCQRCQELNVPLAIDAEYTSVQPAIDYFTYSSAIVYNKDDTVVFGTIQAYLKDAKERMLLAVEGADKMGVSMGFKLVRGAYMSSESKVASSLGCQSPIHNCIQDTHDCYNECASFMLEKISSGRGAVVLATHNVESGKVAAAKARDMGIGKENHKLQFAQLYGMSEALSYGLKNAGFAVSKYMPFGPIDMVMPYLLRRAEENRGVLSTSTIDRTLMRKELKRRAKVLFSAGDWRSGNIQATAKLDDHSAFN
ncbi:proline dehydrogenase 2, mitochondrial [Malania oleifera]|uniref:proline dehydrogenase 2, mitochondrial n=1 Tax=Malania oleifera TaxID=397392 RepID=UPI0025ADBE2D|nr:proline dehydrogenase 2, mitochondrial [Malania oleifera]